MERQDQVRHQKRCEKIRERIFDQIAKEYGPKPVSENTLWNATVKADEYSLRFVWNALAIVLKKAHAERWNHKDPSQGPSPKDLQTLLRVLQEEKSLREKDITHRSLETASLNAIADLLSAKRIDDYSKMGLFGLIIDPSKPSPYDPSLDLCGVLHPECVHTKKALLAALIPDRLCYRHKNHYIDNIVYAPVRIKLLVFEDDLKKEVSTQINKRIAAEIEASKAIAVAAPGQKNAPGRAQLLPSQIAEVSKKAPNPTLGR